jgi:hypothetical protein
MNRSICRLTLALAASALLAITTTPGHTQEVSVIGQQAGETVTPGGIRVPMRRIEIAPAPEFGPGTTLSTASKSGLRLEVRSRFGGSLDYFYYQAEVLGDDPAVAARIQKVEYVDHWKDRTISTDRASHFRRVQHAFGTWTLKAVVTLTPRLFIPRLRERTVVELSAQVAYPSVTGPLPGGLRFVETARYRGNGRYDFELKLEGSMQTLAHVVAVEYLLHPTFPNPTRRATRRADGFALRETCWGAFRIHAKVLLDSGTVAHLQHDLRLIPALPEARTGRRR